MSEIAAADGVTLSYDQEGSGPPIVLVHGFAASRAITWANTGWYAALSKAGRRVLALDCRGHGKSGKPHDVQAYGSPRMVEDIVAVLDGEGIERADIMGYSMGAFIAVEMLHSHPSRLHRAVLAGTGANYFHFWEERSEVIAAGLLAPKAADVIDPVAREFRSFSEKAGNDLVALAACMRRSRRTLSKTELAAIIHPALVVCGEEDKISGSPEPLRASLGNARSVVVPGRNHHSTVGALLYKDAVRTFLLEP